MNYLKIKLGLFTLLAVLAVSVFLTSCEQGVIESTIDETFEVEEVIYFEIPDELSHLSSIEFAEYISSLTDEERAAFTEANRLEQLSVESEIDSRCFWSGWRTYYTRCMLYRTNPHNVEKFKHWQDRWRICGGQYQKQSRQVWGELCAN